MQLYEEIRPHVIALMQDVFGNYVIQKLFEHGTQVGFLGCLSGLWSHPSESCFKWLFVFLSVHNAVMYTSAPLGLTTSAGL